MRNSKSRTEHLETVYSKLPLLFVFFIPVLQIRGFYVEVHVTKRKVKLSKIKLFLCFNWSPRHEAVMGEWRYNSTHSLTSALDAHESSASGLGRFTPREIAYGTQRIRGWVDPRLVLHAVEKRKIPSPCRDSNPDHTVRSPTPYHCLYLIIKAKCIIFTYVVHDTKQ
jgi:hypothetical protein